MNRGDMEGVKKKGKVCVTGGSGYLGSWMVMRLLQFGYFVNTTIRSHPDRKKDVSYVTNLPGAQERLHIFYVDLDKPEGFNAAIEGCIGVFHVAHPIDFIIHKYVSFVLVLTGHQNYNMSYPPYVPFVHVDDVIDAHIFLLENPNAKGRYICSAVEITRVKLAEFLSTRYPEFQNQINEYTWASSEEVKFPRYSSKKLLETGFKYKHGLEEMYDGAIACCKQRSIL
ncbi:vestitone reductase-like isoform X1 [Solanum dulcamara]|uniref:vestitone reductase-like isoform X1 n=1 Tax=Solanum dulcamara TaxID=45834 RepID=UPI002485BA6D|nr:vestitone reductase-like isoform X1 [Solanum dulcamara]